MEFVLETERFRELLDQMKAGSNEAAWELVRLYGPHVRSVVRRKMGASLRRSHDTEDFVQAAWASLVRAMPRLHNVEEPRRFVALLATIACRRLANEVRRKKPIDPELIQPFDESETLAEGKKGAVATPSQIAIAREQWQSLIGDLDPGHQEVIDLRLQGMTYNEIADKTGLHERTARRIVERAIRFRGASQSKGNIV